MTPVQSEFYGRVGHTLLQIQLTERAVQRCLSYFLPQVKTVEEIEAQAEKDREKTLGDLVSAIRKRIAIEAEFDKKLKGFVEDRNTLAHRLLQKEGINITSDEGLQKGIEFLRALNDTAVAIRKTIEGLMRAIDDAPKGNEEDEQYTGLAKVIFGGNP
jgi:hypothetical protein